MQDLNPFEWAIRPLKKYAVFSGRAPRAEYWWYTLATTILGFLVDFVDKAAGDTSLISGAVNLGLIVPSVAVTVRRLHDIDRAGWWVLAFAIPLVIAGAFGASLGTMNFQSASPAIMIVLAITIIAFVIGGMALLVFAVTRGTEGTNRYGPDPYGPDQLEEVFA